MNKKDQEMLNNMHFIGMKLIEAQGECVNEFPANNKPNNFFLQGAAVYELTDGRRVKIDCKCVKGAQREYSVKIDALDGVHSWAIQIEPSVNVKSGYTTLTEAEAEIREMYGLYLPYPLRNFIRAAKRDIAMSARGAAVSVSAI